MIDILHKKGKIRKTDSFRYSRGLSIVQIFLLKVGQVTCKQSHFKPIFLTKEHEN